MVTQIYKKLNWEQDKWENVDKYKWVQIHFSPPLRVKENIEGANKYKTILLDLLHT